MAIDYQDPSQFPAAIDAAERRRGTPATQPYVIGRFQLDRSTGRVSFYALEEGPCYTVAETKNLTADSRKFARWKTRQGAHQWLRQRLDLAHLTVMNLDSLDVAEE